MATRSFSQGELADIDGKIGLGRDRIAVFEDIVQRDPTPRMIESAHTDLADGLVYTIAGVLLALRRNEGQYRSNVEALAHVYPYVSAVAQVTSAPLPTEAQLRSVLSHLPTETRLREILDTRRRSVHRYEQVTYTALPVAEDAYRGFLAFWTASTALVAKTTERETA